MNTDLNLLPSVAKFQAIKIKVRQKVKLGVAIFAGVWLGLTVIIFGLTLVYKTMLAGADKDYKRAMYEYESLAQDIVLTQQIKYKAKVVGAMLDNRFEYGKVFSEIGKLFSGVKMDRYDLRENRVLAINGSGIGITAIDEVEEKMLAINNGEMEVFESAKVTTLSYNVGVWKFFMEVVLK